jgi:hypothetical protein
MIDILTTYDGPVQMVEELLDRQHFLTEKEQAFVFSIRGRLRMSAVPYGLLSPKQMAWLTALHQKYC